jgi:3-hydroxyacyl-[acyl-carrier-protein] dehydratase
MKGLLLNDFFEIIKQEEVENTLNSTIKLSVNHQIFEGHFPNKPITPGVCLMQIVKEILMKKTQKSLLMVESSNIKFLNPVNPYENETVIISINHSTTSTHIVVGVTIYRDTNIFCKFQASYQITS